MVELLAPAYEWMKAAHLIFVIFWMAGLFMLPRFLVYMHETGAGSPEEAVWQERNIRLVKIILNPSLIVVWVLGLLLSVIIGAWSDGWFHAKVLLAFLLSGYHGWMAATARKMGAGARPYAEKTLRLVNEVPGVATALIVVLAIVKPF